MGVSRNRWVGIIVTLAIVFIVIVSLNYGKTLFQEENPIIMAKSILKLEMTNHEYIKISTAPDRFISNNGSKGYTVIKNYMEHLGWRYKDQLGSSLIFEKNNHETSVATVQYTKHFFIWTIPELESD